MYALARITQRAGREGEEQNRFSNNGYFYTLSPLRGVGVTDGFLCNRNWQFLGTVGELEPRRQAPSVGER